MLDAKFKDLILELLDIGWSFEYPDFVLSTGRNYVADHHEHGVLQDVDFEKLLLKCAKKSV